MSVSIAIELDKRRVKKNGKFPIKLIVTFKRNPIRYPTIFDLTDEEYQSLSAKRVSEKLKDVRDKLMEIRRTAQEAVRSCHPFDVREFEKKYVYNNPFFRERKSIKKQVICSFKNNNEPDLSKYSKRFKCLSEDPGDLGAIKFSFCEYIKKLLAEERLGTAITIHDAYRSIIKFRGNMRFDQITSTWLHQYETTMIRKELSRTTIGMYVRALRTIFNEADANGIIQKDKCYPFGRRKYLIPNSRVVKKALNISQIEKIYRYTPANEFEQRARDYWLFCYLCNGINPRDVAMLQYKNIEGEYLVYERSKTQRTGRSDPKIINVYISDKVKQIIRDLGNSDSDPDNYIFPILEHGMDVLKRHETIKLFIAFINKWMAAIGEKLDLSRKPSTVISRHSFASIMKNSGASHEYIREALGHHDGKTTDIYLNSFDNSIKKEMASRLAPFT